MREIFNSINDYKFDNRTIDTRKAAELHFVDGLTFKQIGKQLSVYQKTVHKAVYNDCQKILENLERHREKINVFFLDEVIRHTVPINESFLPDDLQNKKFVLNLLSYIFKYLPSEYNLITQRAVNMSHKKIIDELNTGLGDVSFVLLNHFLDNFRTSRKKLSIFRSVFSSTDKFIFPVYKGYKYIAKNDNITWTQLVFSHCPTPVYIKEFDKIFTADCPVQIKQIQKLLDKCPYVYRLDKDLYGKKQDLAYPDQLHAIQNLVCDKLRKNIVMDVNDVYGEVVKKYPLLKSPYEMKSILKEDKEISFSNSKMFYIQRNRKN